MDCWEVVLTRGILPQMTDGQLEYCLHLYSTNSPLMVQAKIRSLFLNIPDGCFVANCGRADGVSDEGLVAYFMNVLDAADYLLAEPAGTSWFLDWYDGTPREEVWREMRRVLIAELARRKRERDADDSAAAVEGIWEEFISLDPPLIFVEADSPGEVCVLA